MDRREFMKGVAASAAMAPIASPFEVSSIEQLEAARFFSGNLPPVYFATKEEIMRDIARALWVPAYYLLPEWQGDD